MSFSPLAAVHFVKTDLTKTWPDVEQFDDRDIDSNLALAVRLRGGTNSWLVQTYLQLGRTLRSLGIACSIGERFLPGVINIAHRDTLSRFRWVYSDCYVIGLRADRAALKMCDFEVLQNEVEPNTEEQIGIPLWPQPGLLPRSQERAQKIERIAYFGRTGTAATWLRDPAFLAQLEALGTRFEIREDRWYDYQDVDLVLAHRLEAPVMLEHKPPSKLINAWLAGTPAMLGDEPAFINLRRSKLDYLSVECAQHVLDAVRRFQDQPDLYQAMVENGRARARSYDAAALRERWIELLLKRLIPAHLAAPQKKRLSGKLDLLEAFFQQKRLTREFRARYAKERSSIENSQREAS